MKATKDFKLLSFGEEAEGDEQDLQVVQVDQLLLSVVTNQTTFAYFVSWLITKQPVTSMTSSDSNKFADFIKTCPTIHHPFNGTSLHKVIECIELSWNPMIN